MAARKEINMKPIYPNEGTDEMIVLKLLQRRPEKGIDRGLYIAETGKWDLPGRIHRLQKKGWPIVITRCSRKVNGKEVGNWSNYKLVTK